MLERAARELGDRLLLGSVANVRAAATTLIARAAWRRGDEWLKEVRRAINRRPAEWASVVSSTAGRLHPAELFRMLRPYVERDNDTLLVCDGGEIGQWTDSILPARRRMLRARREINEQFGG
jgi:acetolactate synthase I/II/III large subunit